MNKSDVVMSDVCPCCGAELVEEETYNGKGEYTYACGTTVDACDSSTVARSRECELTTERDRLRSALEEIRDSYTDTGKQLSVFDVLEIANKALGGTQ